MNKMVKLAVDMMGGDDAPHIVLEAVEKAVQDFDDLEIILFGDEKQCHLNHPRVEIRHTTEEISMEDEPVRAIKRKKRQLYGPYGGSSEKWRSRRMCLSR